MTTEQFSQMTQELTAMNYPFTALDMSTESNGEIPYFVVKCRSEKIPIAVCTHLVQQPDFDGIMTFNNVNGRGTIGFTYKQ